MGIHHEWLNEEYVGVINNMTIEEIREYRNVLIIIEIWKKNL